MSSWDKLLDRILGMAADVRFTELRRVLEAYGYTMGSHSGGSHVTFRKPGCAPITVPRHDPVKPAYVRMVRDVVMKEQTNDPDA